MDLNASLKEAAQKIVEGGIRNCALTGAGISVESGLMPFRGKGGLWEKVDPMEIAHIDAFMKNPERYWSIRGPFIRDLSKISPNKGHYGLAELEKRGFLAAVITQNIDGLHQRAGSKKVIEFHGNANWLICLKCKKEIESKKVSFDILPPHCDCGGVLRPDVVMFGEAIPHGVLDEATRIAADTSVMLVVGTSGIVQPAASLPLIVKEKGGIVIEINPEETPLTPLSDIFLQGKAGEIIPEILKFI